MICPKCGSENADGSKFCSNCSTPLQESSVAITTKKPLYKKWWFWVIAAISVFIIAGFIGDGSDTQEEDAQTGQQAEDTVEPNDELYEQLEQSANTDTEDDSSNATMGQENALRTAKTYLSTMAFSHDGLVEQLEYEGYSNEEAVYGADNCGADWNEQAAKMAETYLETMAFSRDGLVEQLEYEGFSHDQAVYGAEANGY